MRPAIDLELLLNIVAVGDQAVGLPDDAEREGFIILLVLDVAHEIAWRAVLKIVAEPLFKEGGIRDVAEAGLHLPIVGKEVLMFPQHLAAKGFGGIDAFHGPAVAQVIDAMIEDEIGFEIALEIPRLLIGFGDESPAIGGVGAKARAAFAEIIEAIVHVQIAWRGLAEGFKQAPDGACEDAKIVAVPAADATQRNPARQFPRRRRQEEKWHVKCLERRVAGSEKDAIILRRLR